MKQEEVYGNSRSVMPLDVLECTRVTIEKEKSLTRLASVLLAPIETYH